MPRSYLCCNITELRVLAKKQGMPLADFECSLMSRCPHFQSCSACDCPLDLLQGHRGPDDGDEKCHAKRETRQKIIIQARAEGLIFKLHHDGLTYKETVKDGRAARGRARWEALPEEEKKARIERGKKVFAERRATQTRPEGDTPLEVGSHRKDTLQTAGKTEVLLGDATPGTASREGWDVDQGGSPC